MLDHISFTVPTSKFEEVVDWYLAALAPLGYAKQHEYHGIIVGLGVSADSARFWIAAKEDAKVAGFHVAFKAPDHGTVDRFHDAAVKAGGVDNGKPGIRHMYSPDYYAAFVLDPVGNNVEVVDREAH